MHFVKTLLCLATFLGFVMAQSMQIVSPPPGTSLTPGKNVTVELQAADSTSNIDFVAVVIGLQSCSSTGCYPPNVALGTILYQGPFTPPAGQLTANISVMVPSSFASGTAQLGVINFFLIGAEFETGLQYTNETVTVS